MENLEKLEIRLLDRPELVMLLFYTFIMVLGFTMLMPLVAVYFVSEIKLAAAAVGIALAVRQFTQQGLTIFGGMLADKFGIKPMIAAGVLLRAIGFLSLASVSSIPALFTALILAALGGALFEAPYQAAIISLTKENERQHFYLISNLVVGIATTMGPLLGALLLYFDFGLVCYAAGGCFLVNFFIALLWLPAIQPTEPKPEEGGEKRWDMLRKDRTFILFTLLMMGYWFLSVQINISFPLMAEKITSSKESVGIMYGLSAAITVILQYPLVRWLERYLNAQQILVAGIVIMSISTLLMMFASQSFSQFLLLIAFFSVGALMTRPTQQTITAQLANSKAIATYIGFSSLSLAIGGGFGNFIGGWLYDQTLSSASTHGLWIHTSWVVFSLSGLLSALGLRFLLRPKHISV